MSDARRTLEKRTDILFKNLSERNVLEFLAREIKIGRSRKAGIWTTCACGDSVKTRERGMAKGDEGMNEQISEERKREQNGNGEKGGNNKTKGRGVSWPRPENGRGRQKKNLTELALVSLGSPNNGVRALNKQQSGVYIGMPPCTHDGVIDAWLGEPVNASARSKLSNFSMEKEESSYIIVSSFSLLIKS